MREDDYPPIPPERSAEELKELARHAEDPGARAWYLQWAKAFQHLADIGGRKDRRRNKPH